MHAAFHYSAVDFRRSMIANIRNTMQTMVNRNDQMVQPEMVQPVHSFLALATKLMILAMVSTAHRNIPAEAIRFTMVEL